MQLSLNTDIVIQAWSPGALRMNDTVVTSHCLVHRRAIYEWQPGAIDRLTPVDFSDALALQPEIILFGTGRAQQFPGIELVTHIMQQGIAFEVMDTAAACRTFNVLNGESRAVVAALIV
jgi:uncharacterized protein